MERVIAFPPQHTLGQWLDTLRVETPRLLSSLSDLPPGIVGTERIGGRERIAVALRLSRLFGCPVCRLLFPPLGRRAGMRPEEIEAALEGHGDGLSPTGQGALAWVEAVFLGGGEHPMEIPTPALALTPAQRDHLLFCVRLESLVHATGLLFVPHRWIEHAAQR